MNWTKILILMSMASLLMGAHKCEQDTPLNTLPRGERHLKPLVEMGHLESKNILYADGKVFDFEWAANAQFHENLTRANYFFVPSPKPNPNTGRRLIDTDERLLDEWGHKYGGGPMQDTQDGSCLIDRPQVRIDGEIRSLELVTDTTVSIGFSANSPMTLGNSGPGLSIRVERAILEMGLHADDALTGVSIAATRAEVEHVKRQINANIAIGMLPIGISSYFKTRFAWLTNEAIVETLNDLMIGLSEYYGFEDNFSNWHTRVIKSEEDYIVINAGAYNGLREGDILEVYNDEHFWQGVPCFSQYQGSVHSQDDLAATIKIVNTGGIIALGEVIGTGPARVTVGSKVVLKQFVAEDEPYEP